MAVRVRYAPSPTGFQQMGGVRSALFDYLFARANQGVFILRIEDTDQERTTEGAVQDLYETLAWLGIEWDEGPDKGGPFGPYVQSKRTVFYKRYAAQLLESGHAYRCYCTASRLAELRKQQASRKTGTGYDRHCRNLSAEEAERLQDSGASSVVRFKVPLEGEITFSDTLLGEITTRTGDIPPDPVILKSDGFPTYHLAHVVDDHLMEISHVLRAQEWLPSAPLHVLLFNAFGWEPPAFCHLPMVLGSDGHKLSKRHGATGVREFREEGYLPEAVVNYLALLGWSLDDQREFFEKSELEKLFSLDRLNKAPAVFDYKKLAWFNGQYIRKQSDESLAELLLPYLRRAHLISDPATEPQLRIVRGMIPLIKERLHVLSEAPQLVRFLFRSIDVYSAEEVIPKKLDAPQTLELLRAGRSLVEKMDERSDEENEALFRQTAEELDVKLGALMMPIRVAVTGSTASPPLIGSMRLLGAALCVERIDRAIALLESE